MSAKLSLNVLRLCAESDDLWFLSIEGLALQLAAEFARNLGKVIVAKPPRWLRQARELIDSCYVIPLSLGEIGKQVGVHPVHLAREFHRYSGQTVGGYIRKKRIEQGSRELRKTDMPITEIALSVGFSSQSHFTRAFKGLMGTTPGCYRNSIIHSR